MGLFVPNKRPTPRRFDYEPRFYDPEQETSLRQRLRGARKVRKRSSPTKALYLGIILVIVLYLLNTLGGPA